MFSDADLTIRDDQALGRFLRLGQEKEVHFVRIVVSRAVDRKIIKCTIQALALLVSDTTDYTYSTRKEETSHRKCHARRGNRRSGRCYSGL